MEHRALGKGLSALIPEKVDLAEEKKPANVSFVDIGLVRENSLQPRGVYDEAKLDELVNSIKEKGILQPILVRPGDGGYEVVAGQRRLLAARKCGLEKVPVIVRAVSDQESLVLALIENIQREDLNPIESAQAFRRLINDFHLTQEELSVSVGKDRSTISNIMRLLKLPQNIQQSVCSGALSMGHARALLSVDDPALQKRLFDRTVRKGISVRELENLTRRTQPDYPHREKKKSLTTNPDVLNLENELQQTLGTKVRVIAHKKRGKIVIEYYSPDDLDRILRLLGRR